MPNTTLHALEGAFAQTLANLGFQEVTRREPHSFDDGFVAYEHDGMRLRLVSDRGYPSVEIGSAQAPDEWYDLLLLRNSIQHRDILEAANPDELASFLAQKHELLIEMLTKELASTLELIQSLQQQRAQRMFPSQGKSPRAEGSSHSGL